jgi:hypothetical protein
MILKEGETRHWGTEWCQVSLQYDEADTNSMVAPLHVKTVLLVWTRQVGAKWIRYTNGANGSRAWGWERLSEEAERMGARGAYKNREIFSRKTGELLKWTDTLPGLRLAIEEAEANLPQ